MPRASCEASLKRALLYSRVSTSDKGQNPDVQASVLREFCVARGWTVTADIVDHVGGGTDKRPGFTKLMALVRSRKVDVVLVTKLDRLFRSLKHLIGTMDELEALGVKFVSLGDQIDATTAQGKLTLAILGAMAEFERSLIRERTLAGLAFARSKGVVLGRRRIHDPQAIRDLRANGLSYRAIARELKVPMGTITQALRGAHKSPGQKRRP